VRALGDPGFKYREEAALAAADAGRWKGFAIATTGLAAVSVAFGAWGLLRPEPAQLVSRFEMNLPVGLEPDLSSGVGLAVSPDGSQVVFVGNSSGSTQLWRRPLDQLAPTLIAGTDGARNPRFSPDGTSVAYTGLGRLSIASLAGAPPSTVVLDSVQNSGGISWGPDGVFYFVKTNLTIWRVSEDGGPAEAVTTLGEGELAHRWPEALPNGRGILFTMSMSTRGGAEDVIALLSLETGETETLFQGEMARYARSGHIIYSSEDGTLSAVPFDQDRLELTGSAHTFLEGVQILNESDSYFALSETGVLLYLPGDVGTFTETQLVWVTRSGIEEPVAVNWRFDSPTDNYGWRLSPDGTRVAVTEQSEGNVDIRIKELPDGPIERLTFGDADETFPVWSPDGQWVAYVSGEGLALNAWQKRADGTGDPELLLDDVLNLLQPRWSSDGEWMVFRTSQGAVGRDIVGFRPGQDSEVTLLVASDEFTEWGPDLSPDSRWLAYSSDETGREEVYVRPFPNVDSTRVPISNEGGSNPRWSHSGTELFYVDASGRFVVAQVQTEPEFRVVNREPLFELGIEYLVGDGGDDFYDISLDDQRFLMGRRVGGGEGIPQYVVVQNFFEELRQRVPN